MRLMRANATEHYLARNRQALARFNPN
jgi:hypothetical protein